MRGLWEEGLVGRPSTAHNQKRLVGACLMLANKRLGENVFGACEKIHKLACLTVQPPFESPLV
jgi:hypothetical protein